MRLAVLADIHGNLPALRAVLKDLERFEIDGIIVAGDVAEDFLKHAYRLADEAGYPDCAVIPDDIWDTAAETFRWNLFSIPA
jgi:predicted phosphodiesterase